MFNVILNYPNNTVEVFLKKYFQPVKFHYLITEAKDKIYKKDINIDYFKNLFWDLSDDDKVILVGADVLKHLIGVSGISKLSGTYQEFITKPFGPVTVGLLIDPSVLNLYPHKLKEIEAAIKKLLTNIVITNDKEYKIAESIEDSNYILDKCMNAEILAVDLETSSLYPHKGRILGVCLSTKPHQGFYIQYDYINKTKLQDVFNTAKLIVGHNIKYDLKWLLYNNYHLDKYKLHDTMILSYLNDENDAHGLKELAIKHTDLGDYEAELTLEKKAYCKKYKIKLAEFSYEFLDPKTLGIYGCKDADATQQLFQHYQKLKHLKSASIFSALYQRLMLVTYQLAKLELNGSYVDIKKLEELYNEFYPKIIELRNKLTKYAYEISNGEIDDFNPNSYQQVGNIIYLYSNLPILELTDTGNPSTSSEVLEKLYKDTGNKFIEDLLNYRKLTKYHNTYIEAIKANLDSDNCIRTNFNITGTTSGRLSSSGTINFQNIPSKDKVIKSIFTPRYKDWKIYQQDLVTAEVWVAALESNDLFLQQAFKSNVDFHGYTAKFIFNLDCEPNDVKNIYPRERQIAKTIVFAILYGASAVRIASELSITKNEAQEYIDMFFNQAYQLKQYIEDKQNVVRETGILVSRFGRERRVPEVFSSDKKIAEHAIKSAINFLFQSVASDINLFGFVKGMKYIEEKELEMNEKIFIPTKLVHDSIVGEINPKYLDFVVQTFKSTIQNVVEKAFKPIEIEVEIGDSEGELTPYYRG